MTSLSQKTVLNSNKTWNLRRIKSLFLLSLLKMRHILMILRISTEMRQPKSVYLCAFRSKELFYSKFQFSTKESSFPMFFQLILIYLRV